ncbi:MAG: YbaN family protein [Kofleriaceae bacterium]
MQPDGADPGRSGAGESDGDREGQHVVGEPAGDRTRDEHGRSIRRFIYLGLGFFFVGLGALGAVLPVLPTTPFLLISLWAFSQSSVRFERWLLEHKRFGPRLMAWRTHRVIPWPAKLAAWGSMIASLTIMAVLGRPWWQLGLAASVMAIGAGYVASKPSRPPAAGL